MCDRLASSGNHLVSVLAAMILINQPTNTLTANPVPDLALVYADNSSETFACSIDAHHWQLRGNPQCPLRPAEVIQFTVQLQNPNAISQKRTVERRTGRSRKSESIDYDFDAKGRAQKTLNLRFQINVNGEKRFTDGDLTENKYDARGNLVTSATLKFDLDSTQGRFRLSQLFSRDVLGKTTIDPNYKITPKEIVRTVNRNFDARGKAQTVDTQIFPIQDGATQGLLKASDRTLIRMLLDSATFVKGKVVKREHFDQKGNPQRTTVYEYEASRKPDYKRLTTTQNQDFDLNGFAGKTTVSVYELDEQGKSAKVGRPRVIVGLPSDP